MIDFCPTDRCKNFRFYFRKRTGRVHFHNIHVNDHILTLLLPSIEISLILLLGPCRIVSFRHTKEEGNLFLVLDVLKISRFEMTQRQRRTNKIADGGNSGSSSGKVSCVLCGGFISVSGGDRARFIDHMSNEHDAKVDCHDILLAACVLDAKEKGFLVKSTSTRLDLIGRGKSPNYSDSFLTKITNELNVPQLPAPATNVTKQTNRITPMAPTRQRVMTQSRATREIPRSISRSTPRNTQQQTRSPVQNLMKGNFSISVQKVDMRRQCNMCKITLPNPKALIEHMNKNHFNLPGGINIISGSGSDVIAPSSSSLISSSKPSFRQQPPQSQRQKFSQKIHNVLSKSRQTVTKIITVTCPDCGKSIDKTKFEIHKLSHAKEKPASRSSILNRSNISLQKVANNDPISKDSVEVMDVEDNSQDGDIEENKEETANEQLKNEIENLETFELLDNLVNFLQDSE